MAMCLSVTPRAAAAFFQMWGALAKDKGNMRQYAQNDKTVRRNLSPEDRLWAEELIKLAFPY